jgi:peptidylprolyl isomerase
MRALTIFIGLFLALILMPCYAIGSGIQPARAANSSLGLKGTNTQYSQVQDDVVILVTSMGNISIELFADMPITSGNFKNLTQYGIYDGTSFYRVAHNFVIQGGDAGPKGIIVPTIPDELPTKHSNIRGSVAMAKTNQPNSAESVFFINLVDNTFLDPNFSVFGRVIAGMSVVDSIGSVQTIPPSDGQPVTTISILHAVLGQPIPEYSLFILLTLFVTSTLLAVGVHRRKAPRTKKNLRN